MPFSINKQIEIGRARPVPCRSADKKGPVRSACSWVADCSLSSSSRLFIAGKVTVLWLKVPGPLPLYSQNPYHASMTEIEAFGRYRDRAGLTAKYLSVNRHLITLHFFRFSDPTFLLEQDGSTIPILLMQWLDILLTLVCMTEKMIWRNCSFTSRSNRVCRLISLVTRI